MKQPPDASPTSLSTSEAETLAFRVAAASGSGLSLAAGLYAAAEEADSARLARVLRQMARSIEQGSSLSAALATYGTRLPTPMVGVLEAAEQSGRLGSVLPEWIENRRAARTHWRTITAALMYPLLVVGLALAIYFFMSLTIIPQFKRMFDEFGLKLPLPTTIVLRQSECATLIAWLLMLLGGSALALRLFGGRSVWSQALGMIPLLGNMWHWSGVAEMLRTLSLLVSEKLNLPESLRLTGKGISDAYVGQTCQRLAARVEQGMPLWQAMMQDRRLPMSIVPLVRWGEQTGMLDEALRTAAEMLEGRLQAGSPLLVSILPPLVFLGVAGIVGSTIVALLLPMISLIQGLT